MEEKTKRIQEIIERMEEAITRHQQISTALEVYEQLKEQKPYSPEVEAVERYLRGRGLIN